MAFLSHNNNECGTIQETQDQYTTVTETMAVAKCMSWQGHWEAWH